MPVIGLNGKVIERSDFYGSKKRAKKKAKVSATAGKKPLTRGQKWWASLSKAEQEEYIAKRERNRRVREDRPLPEREVFANGLVKIWINQDSYAIYKPFMLDRAGNPKAPWV